jgi:hypothetical protein
VNTAAAPEGKEKLVAKAATVANMVLAGSGIICLVLLSYSLYRYDWARDREFTRFVGHLLYHVFLVLLAGGCFASLRWRPALKIKLALLLFATGASTYAVETGLTFIGLTFIAEQAVRERAKTAKEWGVTFDRRSRLEVAHNLRQKGVKAYPTSQLIDLFTRQEDGSLKSSLAAGAELLPLGWISNAVLVTCNESGDYLVYESDEHGFHNPKGLWHHDPTEIVAVGNSYVQGYCVPSDQNFVALIRKRYPATLNLGMSGNGPLLMLATIKEYVQIVKPKVVLWFYYEGNDLANLKRESNSPLLLHYMVAGFSQTLFTQQPLIDLALSNYVETAMATSKPFRRLEEVVAKVGGPHGFLQVVHKIATLRQLQGRLRFISGTRQSSQQDPQGVDRTLNAAHNAELDLFAQILFEARESISTWGGKLYFIYLPDWHRYAHPQRAEKHRESVLQLAHTIGLEVIDIHHAFKAHNDPLALFPFRIYSHYNEEGHRLVAEAVLRALSN